MSRISFFLFAALAALSNVGCGSATHPAAGEHAAGARAREGASAAPGAEERRALLLWRATPPGDSGRVVHLLGTVHVGDESFYPLDSELLSTFERSEALAVEVDLTGVEPEKLAREVMNRALLPPGRTLDQLVGPETWRRISGEMKAVAALAPGLMRFEPWFAALTLLQMRLAEQGLRPELGIDVHLMRRAAGRKPVVQLESAESQLDILDSLPLEVQELMLIDALEGSLQAGGELEELTSAWKSGDSRRLEDLLLRPIEENPGLEPLWDALFTDRNRFMAERIRELSEIHDSLFVAVGAGHLLGEEGIGELLEREDWTIERANPSPEARAAARSRKP
ncbi:MAG: TraB/GumN family protein [Polyangia bacterium]